MEGKMEVGLLRQDRSDEGLPPRQIKQGKGIESPREVHCSGIPYDMMSGGIREIFEVYGPITQVRMPLDPTSRLNKGFAIIAFLKAEDAVKAIDKANGKEVGYNRRLSVTRCHQNKRLFVGDIPKWMGKQGLFEMFSEITDGVKDVIIYTSPDAATKNRGFCFIQYKSHKAAVKAKGKLSVEDMELWRCRIQVDWADAEQEVEPDAMTKIKILYVRNISAMVMEEELWSIFEEFGPLERVKKLKDFAFVHFASRDDASKAKDVLNGMKLQSVAIEIQWAKPPVDKEARTKVLLARERRSLVQQALLPVQGTVNPFPQPMGWGEDDNYFYDAGDVGQYQYQLWCPSTQPQPRFQCGYQTGLEEGFFVGDQSLAQGYPQPWMCAAGTTSYGTSPRVATERRDSLGLSTSSTRFRRQWISENQADSVGSSQADRDCNWRNRQ